MINLWKNRDFVPMLLEERDKPFNSKDYIFEIKFDGIRAVIFANKNGVYVQSRKKMDFTYLFPELNSIKDIVNDDVIFDGEIVIFKDGKPDFQEIQKRIRVKNKSRIESISVQSPVIFIAFDILYEGKSLIDLPLIKRKKYLEKYRDTDVFVKVKFIEEDGVKLFNSTKQLGLEGIVAKEKNGLYHVNKRTNDYIKIKNKRVDEFLVGGYEFKKNGILSLYLGEYRRGEFCFVGKGSIRSKSKVYLKVVNSKKSKNYFSDYDENINYVKPSIVCKVEYLEKTNNGHLRHPIIKD